MRIKLKIGERRDIPVLITYELNKEEAAVDIQEVLLGDGCGSYQGDMLPFMADFIVKEIAQEIVARRYYGKAAREET